MKRFKPLRSAMFVGAHPDDETVMAGGTLAMLHQQAVKTHIVCATDGRGGENGDVPNTGSPDLLARARTGELMAAAEALGAASVMLLRYEDPVIGPNEELYGFKADEDELVEQIRNLIWVRGVDLVLTHGSDGEYGHPAHRQIHRAVLRAVHDHLPYVLCYSIAAHVPGVEDRLWNASDPAHLALDITPWSAPKLAAMMSHRTQHALFLRRRKLKEVREAMRMTESYHRHWPAVVPGEEPQDAFAELLREVGAKRPVAVAR